MGKQLRRNFMMESEAKEKKKGKPNTSAEAKSSIFVILKAQS